MLIITSFPHVATCLSLPTWLLTRLSPCLALPSIALSPSYSHPTTPTSRPATHTPGPPPKARLASWNLQQQQASTTGCCSPPNRPHRALDIGSLTAKTSKEKARPLALCFAGRPGPVVASRFNPIISHGAWLMMGSKRLQLLNARLLLLWLLLVMRRTG